jgi:hypothetical protein
MVAVPSAVIFVNNDLLPQPRALIMKQLHINEWMTGSAFDARIAADPNYTKKIKQLGLRIMVERNYQELSNRTYADVVIFVKNGLASVEYNKFGPPKPAFPVLNLHWGQLSVWSPP